ncbi:unnamed protein product [Linum tenue]|uniref:Uncharacterized protein n=1 Tax=Linum tenue TaxID=586396 RepID=A0AAV0KKQ3_9ROSI|nr:unnamed protein product [Linum tenue]
MDSLNEKIVNLASSKVACLGRGFEDGTQGFEMKFMGILKTEPFQPLVLQLEHHGLLTERIREELRCGRRVLICVEDVMRAIHLKSFDYRILNLLLYQLQGEQKLSCGLFEAVMKVNDLHMDFLSISEFLVEIADDLLLMRKQFDFTQDDVQENSFNILRMFVRIYGPSRAPAMLAKCIGDAEEKYERLLKTLEPHLSKSYQRDAKRQQEKAGS